MIGDVVVCIGQTSIGVGRAMRKVLNDYPVCSNGYEMQFLFVDDYGLEEKNPDPADNVHRCQRCAYTWEEGYNNGHTGVVDKINMLLEKCDNPGSIFVIYGAAQSLGSGLCCYLSEYIANNLPGLTFVNIGLLPYVRSGGLDAFNILMSSYASGIYANSRMLRRLDDTDYILHSIGMDECESLGPECSYTCLASDIAALLLDRTRCASISIPSRILDIRSSLWSPVMHTLKTNLRGSKKTIKRDIDRNSASFGGSDIDRCLRLMTMNLHSLHLSSYPSFPSSTGNAAHPLTSIEDARLIAISPFKHIIQMASSLPQQRYCDIVAHWESPGDKSKQTVGHPSSCAERVLTMIQSSTPGVTWPSCIPQLTTCDKGVPYQSGGEGSRGGISSEREVSVASVCFASPYAKSILKADVIPLARKCRQVGAFASSRWVHACTNLNTIQHSPPSRESCYCFLRCRDDDIDLAIAELTDWFQY